MKNTAARRDFEEAFPSLFLAAYHVTLRLLGDVAQAEDAAAETLARTLLAWRRMGELEHREAWVVRVASNLAIDELRRRRRRRQAPWPAGTLAAENPENVTLRLAVGAALSTLPSRQRQVLALRYLVDMDEAQVSRVLGISVNSVKKHATRGRAALRARLGPNPEVSLALE